VIVGQGSVFSFLSKPRRIARGPFGVRCPAIILAHYLCPGAVSKAGATLLCVGWARPLFSDTRGGGGPKLEKAGDPHPPGQPGWAGAGRREGSSQRASRGECQRIPDTARASLGRGIRSLEAGMDHPRESGRENSQSRRPPRRAQREHVAHGRPAAGRFECHPLRKDPAKGPHDEHDETARCCRTSGRLRLSQGKGAGGGTQRPGPWYRWRRNRNPGQAKNSNGPSGGRPHAPPLERGEQFPSTGGGRRTARPVGLLNSDPTAAPTARAGWTPSHSGIGPIDELVRRRTVKPRKAATAEARDATSANARPGRSWSQPPRQRTSAEAPREQDR